MLVAETEYAGLLDWVKQKLGIGYARIKTFSSRELAREASAILTGLNIRHYIKRRDDLFYDLYVENDKVNQAIRAIEGLKRPVIKPARVTPTPFKLTSMIPMFALVAGIPLLALILMRVRK